MADSSGLCNNIFLVFTWRHATTRSFWTCQVSSNMAPPYKTLFNFENQKLVPWLTWPSCIHFWSQKKWCLLFEGILWSCDLLVKTINKGIDSLALSTIYWVFVNFTYRQEEQGIPQWSGILLNQSILFIHGIIHQFFIKIVKTYIL